MTGKGSGANKIFTGKILFPFTAFKRTKSKLKLIFHKNTESLLGIVCGFTVDIKFPDVISINTSIGCILKTKQYNFVGMELVCSYV